MKNLFKVMALAAVLSGLVYAIDYRSYVGSHQTVMRVKTDSTATGGFSVAYDTFSVGYCNDIKSVVGWIRVDAATLSGGLASNFHNFGVKDSVYLTFRTAMDGRANIGRAGKYTRTLDSVTQKIPCSLYVAHTALGAAGIGLGDTLLYHSLWITVEPLDTVNDTTCTATYNVTYDLIGRGN